MAIAEMTVVGRLGKTILPWPPSPEKPTIKERVRKFLTRKYTDTLLYWRTMEAKRHLEFNGAAPKPKVIPDQKGQPKVIYCSRSYSGFLNEEGTATISKEDQEFARDTLEAVWTIVNLRSHGNTIINWKEKELASGPIRKVYTASAERLKYQPVITLSHQWIGEPGHQRRVTKFCVSSIVSVETGRKCFYVREVALCQWDWQSQKMAYFAPEAGDRVRKIRFGERCLVPLFD
jgi:hypothetical protein